GKGSPVAPTGMTWSGFRPSDDACQYGYLIPSNMFAVVMLSYLEDLYNNLFHNESVATRAKQLKEAIQSGIADLSLLTPGSIQGLVIEALGAGNVPPLAVGEIEHLITLGIPVVLVSRCFNGMAEPVYAYEGGGAMLQEAGVMFVKELNAPKARLKLLIALNAGLTGQELKDYIEG
ncbi:glycoside hydrolase family 125 protein, partial [Streptococcus pyogenes]